jgi:ubiquinone/menaquinone biosynthesis C-methylase UbiE
MPYSKKLFNSYLKAIKNPLPELKKTFDSELRLLKFQASFLKNYHGFSTINVLDVGCGAGRPTRELSYFVDSIIGIDNDQSIVNTAKDRCKYRKNVEIINADALDMPFDDNSFEFVYATYNLLGSLEKEVRSDLVREMLRVTKPKGCIINITWNNDNSTTEFLKKYYSLIGLEILKSNSSRTVTNEGTFERLSIKELCNINISVGLELNYLDIVRSLWHAVVGFKL